jgi:hypothetical protein
MLGLFKQKATAPVPLMEEFRDRIAGPGDVCASATVARSLLPIERHQVAWPQTVSASVQQELLGQFPLIDLASIMSMRHRKRVAGFSPPRFALYDTTRAGVCSINYYIATYRLVEPEKDFGFPGWWPSEICDIYRNPYPKSSVQLTATFSGIIPPETKQRIAAASGCFRSTLILQEVVAWDAQVHPMPDPLVIGVQGSAYYLIDAFDTTTLENYVSREFSVTQ